LGSHPVAIVARHADLDSLPHDGSSTQTIAYLGWLLNHMASAVAFGISPALREQFG